MIRSKEILLNPFINLLGFAGILINALINLTNQVRLIIKLAIHIFSHSLQLNSLIDNLIKILILNIDLSRLWRYIICYLNTILFLIIALCNTWWFCLFWVFLLYVLYILIFIAYDESFYLLTDVVPEWWHLFWCGVGFF